MNVRAAIALTIALLATRTALAGGNFPFETLPKLTDTQHLEVVVFFEDLRALRGTLQTQRNYLERARFGKDYFSAEHQKSLYGVDLYGELDRILAIVAPKGSPVPVAAFVVSEDANVFHPQVAVKVEPGILDRLTADKSGAFKITKEDGALTLEVAGQKLAAKVDGDWLRIGPEDNDLTYAGTTPSLTAFPDGIARWTKDAQAVVAVIGGGQITRSMSEGTSDNPLLQSLVETTRAIAITMRWDTDLSQVIRVVLDSDTVTQMGPMVRRSDMGTSAAAGWDEQALTAVSLSVPPMALTTALTLAQMQMGENQDPLVQELAKAVESLDGTLSLASFGAPSDWAMSAECTDDAAAKALVATVHKSFQQLVDKYGVEKGLIDLKQAKDGAPVLTMRPDVQLSASTVTAFGKSVVVARQRMRAERLNTLRVAKKGKSLLDGPLTPAVHEVLARPAILQAYSVSGYDGTTTEWFYWPAKVVEIALKHSAEVMSAGNLDAASLGGPWTAGALSGAAKFSRLPLSLAVAAYGLATSYDYAASLDVDGSDLVFQFAGSQL